MLQGAAAVVGLAQVGNHSEALRVCLRSWGGRCGEVMFLAHHQLWVATSALHLPDIARYFANHCRASALAPLSLQQLNALSLLLLHVVYNPQPRQCEAL